MFPKHNVEGSNPFKPNLQISNLINLRNSEQLKVNGQLIRIL